MMSKKSIDDIASEPQESYLSETRFFEMATNEETRRYGCILVQMMALGMIPSKSHRYPQEMDQVTRYEVTVRLVEHMDYLKKHNPEYGTLKPIADHYSALKEQLDGKKLI